MSDIEFVIQKSKTLEGLLVSDFGAQGRGLHEKLSSVQSKLPEALVKKLRFIATIRNKLVHNTETNHLDDRPRFETTCNEAESQLRSLVRPVYGATSGGSGCAVVMVFAIVIATIVVSFWPGGSPSL